MIPTERFAIALRILKQRSLSQTPTAIALPNPNSDRSPTSPKQRSHPHIPQKRSHSHIPKKRSHSQHPQKAITLA
ncbi:hypothetical protein RI030_03220 [Aphanizomenon flos-aquae NRERC-008]|uniref:Uncharacterized protein n=1 Tax=Aphanizomenon flos-aquae FACHB-1249 TaxID=2692889 RepID=A0ABR8IR40_APHFL|nr:MULTISPECIES: hypothetical protein [Aphanizomenon]MBD2389738.1 hypothetical protein [Aphanizomenon flos-aquae FACHB-1171]MBD2631277.1 hypothetical protein [Aphanizomenon sp. FACHB-1399]MBD2643900.1 hypothetical protein [Aphanizomenon sp. FACHB-1401]MBD2655971.1 hypothetical protein [Aphanizomenon flos-aquae FACHB-1265]MBD2675132.1 hypothetical protein [Aphanizomenon flos-aquae FACHB-1416]